MEIKTEKTYEERIQIIIDALEVGISKERITNPFSGESTELEPLAAALYDFIKGAELTMNSALSDDYTLPDALEPIRQDFEDALAYFSEHWPKEYMLLLD